MIKSFCVRCNKEYKLPAHPAAHRSVICNECHSKEPECLRDQLQAAYLEKFIINN